MTTQSTPFYEESGNITPGRLVLGLLLIVVVALVLAFLYGLIMYYSPLIYINLILCGAFGFALGLAANYAGRLAHLRSLGWRVGFGALAGLLGYLFHWAAYLPAVLSDGSLGVGGYGNELLALFTSPGQTFSMVKLLNTIGVWEIFGISNSGAFGIVVWLIEAAIIIGLPIFLTLGSKIHPYSESKGQFYDKYDVPDGYGGSIASPAGFVQAVQAEGFAPFTQLTEPSPRLRFMFNLYYLEGENRHYLDVNRISATTDKDGKTSENATLVIDNLALDTETARRIKTELKATKSGLSMF